MPELLLEVGCEELPASFVKRAFDDLAENIKARLDEAGVLYDYDALKAMGTPRRLIVCFPNVGDSQPNRVKEQRGPNVQAAYDADGQPTKALLGFCKGQGIEPRDLRQEEGYVWVTQKIPGQPTAVLLQTILPEAIKALNFDKSMRWGASRMRFARPIRWILATFDGAVVPFEIEGVQSGNQSRGHRFYAREKSVFQARNLSELEAGLRERSVEPDPLVRQEKIESQIQVNLHQKSLLIEENVYLTEWPQVVQGNFHKQYLALPPKLLVTVMAKHEKMFPVYQGDLAPAFQFVRNSGEDKTVTKGAEWVLNARLNDAKFFYDEDQKHTLDDFLAKTEGILFAQGLGTVRQKADRLSAICRQIATLNGEALETIERAGQAGLYAKADLSTGLVNELPDLQGYIGAYYAKDAFPSEVITAIERHYDLSDLPAELGKMEYGDTAYRMRVWLVVADQIDRLAGYLGLGKAPSGSSDPFALRRAAQLVIKAYGSTKLPPLQELFEFAGQQYASQSIELPTNGKQAMTDLLINRYESSYVESSHDVREAAVLGESGAWDPCGVEFRLSCMQQAKQDTVFIQTATRPQNIVQSVLKKGLRIPTEFSPRDLESESGQELLTQTEALEQKVRQANPEQLLDLLKSLAPAINAFFDTTMVMVEDEKVKNARLSLLQRVSMLFLLAGDFSKLVIEG